jgi:WD40-like Beta Propeller Repeat
LHTPLVLLKLGGCPTWSPDSTRIASWGFIDLDNDNRYDVSDGETSGLYVTTLGGAFTEVFDTDGATASIPTNIEWSPVGDRLTFELNEGAEQKAYILDLAAPNAPIALTPANTSDTDPAWSSDGQFIAVARIVGGQLSASGIYVIPVSPTPNLNAAYRVTGTDLSDARPTWSPDSQWIAVDGSRGNGIQIIVMHVNSGLVIPLGRSGIADRDPKWAVYPPGYGGGVPTATPTQIAQLPTATPTPTPIFTALDLFGEDIELQGVMFWIIFWETISDSSDSGSPADSDLPSERRFTEFLFNSPYCSLGANPPSDNAVEEILVPDPADSSDAYWVYITHCAGDHRFMFARTILNGFLNYERRGLAPLGYATSNNSSLFNALGNTLWQFTPCTDQGINGASFNIAQRSGTTAEWLYSYMNCLGTSSEVDTSNYYIQRIRRAYSTTILPKIQDAIANFYAPPLTNSMADPTYGAFSNLDVNLGGASLLTCIGGCYLSTQDNQVKYAFNANDILQFRFAKFPSAITLEDVIVAYRIHIAQQVSLYGPNYSSILQPVLRREFDRQTGVLTGYLWTTRVYQRSPDMRHFPR